MGGCGHEQKIRRNLKKFEHVLLRQLGTLSRGICTTAALKKSRETHSAPQNWSRGGSRRSSGGRCRWCRSGRSARLRDNNEPRSICSDKGFKGLVVVHGDGHGAPHRNLRGKHEDRRAELRVDTNSQKTAFGAHAHLNSRKPRMIGACALRVDWRIYKKNAGLLKRHHLRALGGDKNLGKDCIVLKLEPNGSLVRLHFAEQRTSCYLLS